MAVGLADGTGREHASARLDGLMLMFSSVTDLHLPNPFPVPFLLPGIGRRGLGAANAYSGLGSEVTAFDHVGLP